MWDKILLPSTVKHDFHRFNGMATFMRLRRAGRGGETEYFTYLWLNTRAIADHYYGKIPLRKSCPYKPLCETVEVSGMYRAAPQVIPRKPIP
jgi:hypothetical protein